MLSLLLSIGFEEAVTTTKYEAVNKFDWPWCKLWPAFIEGYFYFFAF